MGKHNLNAILLLLLFGMLILIIIPKEAYSQLERKRTVENPPVELTFMAQKHINLYTTELLSRGEFHYSIIHAFGEVNNGIQDLWGIDNGANVKFYFDYGVSDNINIIFSRTSQDKVLNLTARAKLLQQKQGSGSPLSATANLTAGLTTAQFDFLDDSYTLSDRMQFTISSSLTRKFTDRFSLLISPIFTHFNRTGLELGIEEPEINSYFSVGSGLRYKVLPRMALTFQSVLPVTEADLDPNIAIGLDIETGGHVFQIFFTTSRALNETYLIAAENGSFFDREFRFGFNVNRLFKLH
ncbi:MAG: DUF5777 family beta-barrel protein [Balneolaceae bacterium]|nr:DUF5777 family beta-barrel protein [Balneolaceae bacterium]MDR9410415.1 DUF5777 family beta-barrel protein [Balneolaceae bacterium]